MGAQSNKRCSKDAIKKQQQQVTKVNPLGRHPIVESNGHCIKNRRLWEQNGMELIMY